MAFYSPNWVRKLIKEEAKEIAAYVSKKNSGGKYVNDFRDYIDATLPFALWLDMKEIKDKVLAPSQGLMQQALSTLFADPKQLQDAVKILNYVLEQAYIKVINSYIDNPRFLKISARELETKLNNLTGAEVGKVKSAIKENFARSMVITTVSKPDTSVMLVTPKFTTVEFGKHFREALDFAPFGGDPDYLDSPSRQVRDLLFSAGGEIAGKKQDFFTQLQNIGHIEVDVISSTTREVKRGQSSPRLLQALVSVPNNPRVLGKLQREFSQETLQAESRVIIRKRFSSSKMVFEMLVESGMSVGIPETQAFNLVKAAKELAFETGKGLTAEIRKNPSIFVDLETSKSAKQYIANNLASLLATGKGASNYESLANFKEVARGSVTKVKLKLPQSSGTAKKQPKPPKLKTREGSTLSLLNLRMLIDSHLQDVVSANMGDGNRRDVLNYRTGRFASSVKLQGLSQSRDGMITAFYTYMKNPYATFSAGGRQQNPRSRDPKLLIAKSIREIAAETVSNRLRAVLV